MVNLRNSPFFPAEVQDFCLLFFWFAVARERIPRPIRAFTCDISKKGPRAGAKTKGSLHLTNTFFEDTVCFLFELDFQFGQEETLRFRM